MVEDAVLNDQNKNQALFNIDPNINYFGMSNYRNQYRKFGIKIDDRRRHMYVVGKTGMGKTTMLENMVLNDIYAGHGVGLVDPHGDFAEKILNYIPSNRINDVVYFNPADIDFPIGFNILEMVNQDHKHLVASGLMGVFKKIWVDMWSSRMEYILNNTILALLDFPGTTLLGINRLLADDEYRKRVVSNLKDPVVKAFWQSEFAAYNDRYNIVAQVKSRINIREIMDSKKIFIMNLSKGRIGEDNSRLLGGMLITKIQLSAMERVDTPEAQRNDFFLYVDEFQNFATESFANILSEARKYRLSLILAHQYMEQLDETVLAAVIGNVGTLVAFRVGSTDAEILAKEFAPTFLEPDIINLPKFQIYLKLMIDGIASQPFSAMTLPPIAQATASSEKVIKVSRERYAVQRDKIEDKIMRWSGMEIGDDMEEFAGMEDNGVPAPVKKPEVVTAPPSARPAPKQIKNIDTTVARRPTARPTAKPTLQTFGKPKPTVADKKNFPSQLSKISNRSSVPAAVANPVKPLANTSTPTPAKIKPTSIVDTDQKGFSLSTLLPSDSLRDEVGDSPIVQDELSDANHTPTINLPPVGLLTKPKTPEQPIAPTVPPPAPAQTIEAGKVVKLD